MSESLKIIGIAPIGKNVFGLTIECVTGDNTRLALMERLNQARGKFHQECPQFVVWRRCELSLQTTQERLVAAEKAERTAANGVKLALSRGDDPANHEQDLAEAKTRVVMLKERAGLQRDAKEAARVAVGPPWQQFRREFSTREHAALAEQAKARLGTITLSEESQAAIIEAAEMAALLQPLSMVQEFFGDWP